MELFDGSKIEDELKIPYSIEAEEALLGSIFIKPDAISEVIEIITAMDFYKNNYRIIFEEMLKAYNLGKIIDTLLIVEALKKSDLPVVSKKLVKKPAKKGTGKKPVGKKK